MASEDDVLNSVIFLASEMSNYITGQNIVVDVASLFNYEGFN